MPVVGVEALQALLRVCEGRASASAATGHPERVHRQASTRSTPTSSGAGSSTIDTDCLRCQTCPKVGRKSSANPLSADSGYPILPCTSLLRQGGGIGSSGPFYCYAHLCRGGAYRRPGPARTSTTGRSASASWTKKADGHDALFVWHFCPGLLECANFGGIPVSQAVHPALRRLAPRRPRRNEDRRTSARRT